MAGFNGQEGAGHILFFVFPMVSARNESTDDGCSMEMVTEFLSQFCSHTFTTQAPELCTEFIIQQYGLDTAADGRERAVRLSYLFGKQQQLSG